MADSSRGLGFLASTGGYQETWDSDDEADMVLIPTTRSKKPSGDGTFTTGNTTHEPTEKDGKLEADEKPRLYALYFYPSEFELIHPPQPRFVRYMGFKRDMPKQILYNSSVEVLREHARAVSYVLGVAVDWRLSSGFENLDFGKDDLRSNGEWVEFTTKKGKFWGRLNMEELTFKSYPESGQERWMRVRPKDEPVAIMLKRQKEEAKKQAKSGAGSSQVAALSSGKGKAAVYGNCPPQTKK